MPRDAYYSSQLSQVLAEKARVRRQDRSELTLKDSALAKQRASRQEEVLGAQSQHPSKLSGRLRDYRARQERDASTDEEVDPLGAQLLARKKRHGHR